VAKELIPLDEDGPTLNGHPILGVEDVRSWFSDHDCNISEEAALSIARLLNTYESEGFFWKDIPELERQRRDNPSRLRNVRIADALRSLQADLPSLIEDHLRVNPDPNTERLRPHRALLDSVNDLAPRFKNLQTRKGRKSKNWHIVARKIGALVVETLKTSTGRAAGLGKPTSPAVQITQSALAYLGVKAKEAAIVEAVRPKRIRARKGVGK
jgi:hypothetical protein